MKTSTLYRRLATIFVSFLPTSLLPAMVQEQSGYNPGWLYLRMKKNTSCTRLVLCAIKSATQNLILTNACKLKLQVAGRLWRVIPFFLILFYSTTLSGAPISAWQTGNWSNRVTWIGAVKTGTITSLTTSTTVTGTGTFFLTELTVGDRIIFISGNDYISIGTIASIASNTSLTLTANSNPAVTALGFYSNTAAPGSADDVTIARSNMITPVTVTVDVNASCTSLTLAKGNAGGTIGNFTVNVPAGVTLTVSGTTEIGGPNNTGVSNYINVSGTFNGTYLRVDGSGAGTRIGALAIADGGIVNITGDIDLRADIDARITAVGTGRLNLGGNMRNMFSITGFANSNTINFASTSVLNFNGSVQQTLPLSAGFVYGTVYFNNTSANGATLSAAITATNVLGDFKVQSGVFTDQGSATMTTLRAASLNYTIGGNAAKTFQVDNGAFFKAAGTSSFTTGFGTITLQPTSTVDYIGTTQTIAPQNFGNLTVSAGAAAGRAVTLSATGTIGVFTNFTPSSTNNVYTITSSTVAYNGNLSQTMPSNFATYTNLTVAGSSIVTATANFSIAGNLLVSSGTLDLSDFTANRASAGGTLTVSNGAALKIGGTNTFPSNYSTHSIGVTSTIEYSGTTQSVAVLNSAQDYGNLIIAGSGTKTLAGTENVAGNLTISAGIFSANNFNMAVGGNWTNNSTFTPGTGTVTFNGTSAQTVSGSLALDLSNLVTNNSSGIILNNNLSVSGAHTFSAGIITTSSTPNYMIYKAGSSYTGSGDGRHVNGWVKKIGGTNFIFPVGNATYERSIALNNLSIVTSSEFNIRHNGAVTPNRTSLYNPLVYIDTSEYWTINIISGTVAEVAMNWDNSKVPFPNLMVTDIRAAYYDGIFWRSIGGSATGSALTTGSLTSNSVSAFNNNFTFGSVSYVLPLKIISFTALRMYDFTKINWTIGNELNVDHYELECSDDGINFYTLTAQSPYNRSGTEFYSYNDSKILKGTSYYRLKINNNSTQVNYSHIVSVSEKSISKDFYVITNPVDASIDIYAAASVKGIYNYTIANTKGQVMQSGMLDIKYGGIHSIKLRSAFSTGAYMLALRNENNELLKTIIKK